MIAKITDYDFHLIELKCDDTQEFKLIVDLLKQYRVIK